MLSTQASHIRKFTVQNQSTIHNQKFAKLKRSKYNKLDNILGMNKWVAVCDV